MVLRAAACLLLGAGIADAHAAGECHFAKQPPVFLKDMGPCKFDVDLLNFAGDPKQQAACLLTPVEKFGKLAPSRNLPDALATRVSQHSALPDRDALRALLQERGLDELTSNLPQPVAQAYGGDPYSHYATYFVIHDTSSPNFLGRAWPGDIDGDPRINNLANYSCSNKIERAHVFINRSGAILLAHDFEMPWRATKFEMAVGFGSTLKGLFLHTELIQPRRREPRRGRRNDFQAPNPGFARAQYDALALVYVVASVRAGFWLIPAFHAVIDEGIPDKHDDPQNFELTAFADSLERLCERLRAPR